MKKKILSLKNIKNKSERQKESGEGDSDSFNDIYNNEKENSVNLIVPISKMKNEHYKILKSKQLKLPKSSPYFSAKKIFIENNNEEDYKKYKEFPTLKKKKAIHSTKKIYSSFYQLIDEENIHHFHIYKDFDISFNEFWQKFLIKEIMGLDAQTDEETQKYGIESYLN